MTRYWQLRNERWQLSAGGAVMGILNSTPDSFSDGGCFNSLDKALEQAQKLIDAGADVLDIGGESTRPGAQEVSLEEERARTIPLLRHLRANYPQLRLSIDTRHHPIAAEALDVGVDIINDISGLQDEGMLRLCAASPCGIILMHMQGQPETMQDRPEYHDVIEEIQLFFKARLRAIQAAGIAPERICWDPGIGFGKSLEHNLAIIRNLEQLRPEKQSVLMMALSRKRMLGEILGSTEAGRSSLATAVMSLLSTQRGADIHRVHDVAATKTALKLAAVL